MPSRLDQLTQQVRQKLQPKPAAVGYAGVPDGLGYPGTVVDGYVYDIPDKPGYQYFRATMGVEQEVGEAIIGAARRDANRKIEFDQLGGALVARHPSGLSSVAGSGADAGLDWVPDHRHPADAIDYTPTTPGDWIALPETDQQAIDELAGRIEASENDGRWRVDYAAFIPASLTAAIPRGINLTPTGSLIVNGSVYIV